MVLGSLPHTMEALASAGEAGDSFDDLCPEQRRLCVFAALAVMRMLAASGVGLEPVNGRERACLELAVLAAIRRLSRRPKD